MKIAPLQERLTKFVTSHIGKDKTNIPSGFVSVFRLSGRNDEEVEMYDMKLSLFLISQLFRKAPNIFILML